ncbi:hypothetical protein DRJ22_05125 [Candidatus Woesearchaeota archaeon]|nr:MAG: hypothetical protein DRJ22_05125 [Candidatus Woesearchaeota archaeon]
MGFGDEILSAVIVVSLAALAFLCFAGVMIEGTHEISEALPTPLVEKMKKREEKYILTPTLTPYSTATPISVPSPYTPTIAPTLTPLSFAKGIVMKVESYDDTHRRSMGETYLYGVKIDDETSSISLAIPASCGSGEDYVDSIIQVYPTGSRLLMKITDECPIRIQ